LSNISHRRGKDSAIAVADAAESVVFTQGRHGALGSGVALSHAASTLEEHRMIGDHDIRENALEWDPGIEGTTIAVAVDHGVVTLRGDVESYAEKVAAERVALRVFGVRGVANNIEVRIGEQVKRTDTDIAQAAVNMIAWNATVPPNQVTVTVDDGWVSLNGIVDTYVQRSAAEGARCALSAAFAACSTLSR
jgi:osmotically-inducible protein OsmY